VKGTTFGGGAAERGKTAARVELTQLVAFGVGDGDYAVDIMRIKEIINPVAVTPMPKAPPFIEGVIELRGAILPIVDVRKRFDMTPTSATRAPSSGSSSIACRSRCACRAPRFGRRRD